ncbi:MULTISPECIES: hypothetical protein [unclassified Streptomyces]|uniref:hypothetical protein n=1 Tax=unclassified Streptomyces TaxID=2593676 RepID=UPI00225B6FDB|nr:MULTISPECIES: hypothetical protein [unclassified Streptomyces]MCX4869442.1 hypothetical protein [Streptomyces sp. NBC_00906]MCX4900681.1 hypothetical protein [Streptomyces sp. NBC_00892]
MMPHVVDDRVARRHLPFRPRQRLAEFSANVSRHTRYLLGSGAQKILRWLEEFPCDTWQQRWRNSGCGGLGRGWRDHLVAAISDGRYGRVDWAELLGRAHAGLRGCNSPQLEWLMTRQSQNLRQIVSERRDPDDFAVLAAVADRRHQPATAHRHRRSTHRPRHR